MWYAHVCERALTHQRALLTRDACPVMSVQPTDGGTQAQALTAHKAVGNTSQERVLQQRRASTHNTTRQARTKGARAMMRVG